MMAKIVKGSDFKGVVDYILDKGKGTQVVTYDGLFMENKETIAMSFNIQFQINGKVAKPSSEVKEGDMLDILMGGKHTVVKVTSVQEFTTKAAAAEMYEMITRGDLE